MKHTILIIATAAMFAACGGQNKTSQDTDTVAEPTDAVACTSIQGCWNLQLIVSNKYEIVQDVKSQEGNLYANFNEDGTFSFSTDCNTVSGEYTTTGDSISLKIVNPDIVECCDHAEIENMLRRALPTIETIETVNDSVIRLCTNETNYIKLKKLKVGVKCITD